MGQVIGQVIGQVMGRPVSGLRISVRGSRLLAAATMWLIGSLTLDVVALDQAHSETTVDPLQIPDSQLEPIQWSELNGWKSDDHGAAFAAFQASCEVFNRQHQLSDTRAVAGALRLRLLVRLRDPRKLPMAWERPRAAKRRGAHGDSESGRDSHIGIGSDRSKVGARIGSEGESS